jgi:hypothetical protein
MNKLTKLIYDLSGTPYITIWFIGKGIVTNVKHYKMDEKINTEYGHFKTPSLDKLIFKHNVYYGFKNIDDCETLKLTNSSLVTKIMNKLKKSKDYVENKRKEIELDEFVISGLSPMELQSYLESQSITTMMKSTSKKKMDMNMLVLVIVGAAAAFIGYKMFFGGGL